MKNISAIFSEYNRQRGLAVIERGRLNRALGYAQRVHDPIEPEYGSTMTRCQCPDHTIRRVPVCKHMAARRLQMGGRDYILIWVWAQTYNPRALLETDPEQWGRIAEQVKGEIWTASRKHPKPRPARKSPHDVFEYLSRDDNGLKLVWVSLIDHQNGPGGWFGKYEMAFART